MRKIIFKIAVSEDGFIEGKNGELDWIIFDEETNQAVDFAKNFDTVLYSRITYEKFGVPRTINPFLSKEAGDYDTLMNTMKKYVFSRTLKKAEANVQLIKDNIEKEVRKIQQEKGKDIWLCGGANLLKTFVDLDLVDEFILAIHPRILGEGKPLFKNITTPLNLKLIKTDNLKSGVIVMHYLPASRVSKEPKK
jgi:dihydrofolate reductase